MARHDESELTLLNERNIHALHEAIKDDRQKVNDAIKEAKEAKAQVAMLKSEIDGLRAQLAAILQARF